MNTTHDDAVRLLDTQISRATESKDWPQVARLTRLILWLAKAGQIHTERIRNAH